MDDHTATATSESQYFPELKYIEMNLFYHIKLENQIDIIYEIMEKKHCVNERQFVDKK